MNHVVVDDILLYIDQVAPFRYQESYDNAGLICGSRKSPVTGVITCLDTTEAVIDEAIHRNCNVVIGHHPIIFRGLKNVTDETYIGRAIIKAIQNDVAIIAVHTNLDNILINGVNERLAHKLGLIQLEILNPNKHVDPSGKVGAGVIGTLKSPAESSYFLEEVKVKMQVPTLKHTPIHQSSVLKVAVCGGSGIFLLGQALAAKADVFITSDVKYHEFFDAVGKLILIDIGHYESEQHTIELLAELISNKFTTFAAHCTKVITNPVKYL